MPETTETFLACHEWDTPLGARGKGRDLLTSGSSFSRQARLGQGINPPPKLHGRREPGAPRTHSQRALGARGPDEEPNRQPDPQAQRSARVSTRPPLHRRALPTTAQPEEEPGRNGGTRSYKKPSATVELGGRPSKHSGSDQRQGRRWSVRWRELPSTEGSTAQVQGACFTHWRGENQGQMASKTGFWEKFRLKRRP